MKSYLFLSYPADSYFLAHVYEQLLAFELIKNNLVWKTGNIGNGYIFVEWNKKIDKNKILELIKIPDLDKSSLKKAQKIVAKETKNNLEFKPFFELCHFQVKTYNEIYATIEQKIDIYLMENFIQKLLVSSEIVIIYNDQYLVDTRKNIPLITKNKLYKMPFILSTPNKKIHQLVVATNAHSVLDGYVFSVFGNEIVKYFAKYFNSKISYLSVLDTNKTLFLTFSTDKDINVKKIESAIKILAPIGFQGPLITKDNIFSLNNHVFQYLDWQKVLPPQKIKRKMDTRPIYNFSYHNGTLSLN
ncbi:MAG: hypothetical protein UR93_C0035G0002 [Berkelbacteria bacterium GW2011_GWA2_35_9]|uniref:Uncharacterized protein n=1 Tax=Berkelbacteria bacterium GW2011_GWA2_35_9 TaxID=1618333 RepID=A0A0G0DG34_9BACT|nr:MAG: hypothetical protein UR93_C0035G0002 [Berkelbacteria bacterium GW2011_GWA2_35_9]